MHKLSLNPVHKFGPDKLPEGSPKSETLTSAILSKATAALGDKPKKASAKLHMHIHPVEDGRFHVAHEYRGGDMSETSKPSTEHAPGSIKELLDHVKKHYSTEEASEGAADSPAEEKSEGETP